MGVLRSTDNFTATAIMAKEVAFKQKNLQGNQSLRPRIPCMRSAAIVMRQARDAAAMYMPIHGIGLLNLVSSICPSLLQPIIVIFLGSDNPSVV